MTEAERVVRDLWERIQARDWDGVAALLHEDFTDEWPVTGERITGRDRYVAMNREYPEPWGPVSVRQVVAAGDRAAADVEVPGGDSVFRCVGFYELRDGRLARATEYWTAVGEEEPPPGREHLTERF